MQRLHKGQLEGVTKGDVLAQNRVTNQLFGLAASQALAHPLLSLQSVFATLPHLSKPSGEIYD
jgi:hypothetical protein